MTNGFQICECHSLVKTRAEPAGELKRAPMAKTSESGVWYQDPPGSGRAGSTFVKRTPNLKQAAKVVRDDWDDDDDDDEEEEEEGDVEEETERDVNAKAKASGPKNVGTAPAPAPGSSGRREGEPGERKGEEESSKIWEEANKRAPMPDLIVAPASTSQSFPPPPPAAFQPTLRILKRPSPNTGANNAAAESSASLSSSSPGPTSGSGSGSGGASPAPRGTLAEREAQYQEARSRIFGEKEKPGTPSGNASSDSMSRTSSVVAVRDPLGPASEPELEPEMSGQNKVHGPGRPAKGFGERRRGKK